MQKGDGSFDFLKNFSRHYSTLLGNQNQNGDCQKTENCQVSSGSINNPVSLASGKDGSVYLGDGEEIKKIVSGGKDVAIILRLE